jgi:hypothetical protein
MRRAALVVAIFTAFAGEIQCAAAQPAAGLPARRPGQWEMQLVTEKPPGSLNMTAQMCLDSATDRDLMNFGLRMSKETCKRYDMKHAGKVWVIDAECAFGPVVSVTHTTVSGDFQSLVTVRVEGTTEGTPGGKGPQPLLMTQTSRFVSAACGAGMKPGDIAIDGGLKFNVKQLKGLQKLIPQIQIR